MKCLPRFRFLNLFTVLMLTTAAAQAQSAFTWNGGGTDGNWTTGANWGGTPDGGRNELSLKNNFTVLGRAATFTGEILAADEAKSATGEETSTFFNIQPSRFHRR